MKIAYLIHSHRNVAQVRRLVDTLKILDPGCLIFVSHDQRGDPGIKEVMEGVAPVTLERGSRGGFHPVDRWLRGVAQVREAGGADFVVLLSGQDYPVRSLDDMHRELAAAGDGFVEDFPALEEEGNHWPVREGRTRYLFRWRELWPISDRIRNLLYPLHAVNRLQPWLRVNVAFGSLRMGVRGHGVPTDLECRGGSMFTSVSWRVAQYVSHIAATRPDVMEWARESLVIDESFVQTVLTGSNEFVFERNSRRFYIFDDSKFGHPRLLEDVDIAGAVASGAFFARKFDMSTSPEVLDMVDEHLGIHPRGVSLGEG